MGRRNKAYSKDLHQQAYDRLTGMQAFGESKKEAVAKFSFLMVLIPILGEALLDLMKGGFSAEASGISTMSLLVGFMAAFVSGCIACRWMINIVKKGKLIWFALYCAIVGILTIVLG